MQIIKIKRLVDQCATKEAGFTLYKKIKPILESNNQVTLDFEDMDKFSHTFFNNSIGALIIATNGDQILSQIELVNISAVGRIAYHNSIENALLILDRMKNGEWKWINLKY